MTYNNTYNTYKLLCKTHDKYVTWGIKRLVKEMGNVQEPQHYALRQIAPNPLDSAGHAE